MAANMYDQAALAQFINTYVPINFGELYRIGAAQKAAIDEAAQRFGAQLLKFGEFQSPSLIDTLRYYDLTIGREDFQNAINQMVANPDYLKDAANRSLLLSMINSVDYSTLSNLKSSRDAMLKRLEINQRLMLENRFNPLWHDVDFANYDTVNSKIFDDITPLPYMSIRELVEPYVNNLKGEFLGAKNGFLWNGVTDEMTDAQLQNNLSSIQNTPQYQKYLETYQKMGLSPEQAQQQLLNEIYTAGREYTWNKADRDPMAIENMRLQRKYASAANTASNLLNLTRVLESDATRNHLLKFTNLTPLEVDAFAEQGFKALTPEKQQEVLRLKDPGYVENQMKNYYDSVLKDTRRRSTAEDAVIDLMSTPISYEASDKYAAYGTTGKQDRNGFYTVNNSSNFKLAKELVYKTIGEEANKGLQKFISLWNDGNNFSNFKISSDLRMISDGKDIYVVKYAYIPEDQLLKARIDRKSLSALGTPVTVDAGLKTTERYDNRGNLESTTTSSSTPVKSIRITVLQQLPRSGEAAITSDAAWMDKNLGIQTKTQDIQDMLSLEENL
ncbi:nuclear pore complex protein-like protein [uncultured phage cr60_1]|uniref:Nuclear pore complex protein-like protein n=1 Tax=uncultured phage cr60_1 TaxID=2772082 RepID=A0A7M1RTF8_9CAUD|nr:nuclear pore complex protein-like protein [uncultured phage cr60_1]QOR56969.1 nuclear pore complex protein-like protein [uncultured phage cr60_1]